MDRHLLFFNCHKDWYLNGIPGFGDSIEKSIHRIQDIISNQLTGCKHVVTYGGSMGGAGALLYGSLLNADYSIACGAETLIGIFAGMSRPFVDGRRVNIKRYVKKTKGKVVLLYGEYCITDVLCALSMKQLDNVEVFTVANQPHAIPSYIHLKYGLGNIIDICFRGEKFQLDKIDSGNLLFYPNIIKWLYAIKVAAAKRDINRFTLLSRSANSFFDEISEASSKAAFCYALGESYKAVGLYIDAKLWIEKSFQFSESNHNIILYIECLQSIDKNPLLASAFEVITSGMASLEKYDISYVDRVVSRLKEENPPISELYIKSSQIKAARDDLNGALEDAEMAIQINCMNPSGYLQKGRLCFSSRDYIQAELSCCKAKQLSPTHAGVRILLSYIYFWLGDVKKAMTEVDAALLSQPDNISFLLQKANLLTRQGDFEEAESLYLRVLKLDPKRATALLSLSRLYAQKGEIDVAISMSEEAKALMR